MIFRSPWFWRGLRLSVPIGLLAAGWHAWGVFDRYSDDLDRSIKSELTYKCAARLREDMLKPYMNEYGNINVRKLCLTEDDFFVAPYELEAVRDGTMKFEPTWQPFDWPGTVIVGLIWAIGTILATIGALGAVAVTRWVRGKPSRT